MYNTDNGGHMYDKDDLQTIAGCLDGTIDLLKRLLPPLDEDVYEDMHKYATWLTEIADGMSEDDLIVCDGFSTTIKHWL